MSLGSALSRSIREMLTREPGTVVRSARLGQPKPLFSAAQTLMEPYPSGTVPAWMPPLAIEDLFQIDEAVLRSLRVMGHQIRRLNSDALRLPVDLVWRLRLPMRAVDLLPAFTAHGLPSKFNHEFVDEFDARLDQLIWSVGRKPIARRRMPAMSQGRYERKYRNPRPAELLRSSREW